MTPEEAIKELTDAANEAWDKDKEKRADACQLGIEALKMWTEVRKEGRWPASTRLPGETKE